MANEEVGNLNVKVSMDQTGFQNGISSINTQLKVVQSSFKAASAQLGSFGNSTDQMKLKADSLSQQVELQRQKVDSLTAAFAKSVETKGADATATQNLQVKLNLAQAALSNMENELKKTNEQLKVVGWTNLSKSMDEISTKMEAVGKKMSSVGKTLTTSLTLPIVGIGVAAEKSTLDFGDGMAKVSTIADTTQVSMDNLSKGVLKMSGDTGKGTDDLNEALYQTISATNDTSTALDYTTVAAKAAVGGFTDTATSVDGLTTVMNAYGLQGKQAITEVSDEMLVAQNFGKTTFGEMAQSIGNVIPIAASLNVSTKELFASIATLTKNGIQTSQAITGLKEAYSNILKPQSQAIDLAEKLGLKFNASELQSKGWAGFLDEIKTKTGGNAQQMATLFGSVEALNSVMVLAGKGSGDFANALKAMDSAAGATDAAFEKMNNTDAANLRKSFNDLKNAGIQLGEALTPIVTKIADVVKGLAESFKSLSPAQQEMVVKIGLIAAAIGPVLATLGPLMIGISGVAKAFGAVSEAIAGAGGFIPLLTGTLLPIAGVIAGIVALAAAAFLIIKNWGPIKEFFQKLWIDVSNGFTTAWDSITSTVRSIIQEFTDFINTYFGNQLKSITNILKNIANIFQQEWTIIKNVVLGIVLLLIDLITGDFGKFKSDLEGILNNIKNAFGSIWTSIKTIVIEQINILKDTAILIFNTMKTAISDTITGVKDSIINGITVAIDWIKALPSQAVQWGSDFITGFKNGIMNAMNSLLDAVKSVANNIRSFLHFSTPDQGPLADYETWMPDFMAGLASGINKSKGLVTEAINGLATDMGFSANITSPVAAPAGGLSVTIVNRGNIIGSSGMKEFAKIVSREIAGDFGLSTGGGW